MSASDDHETWHDEAVDEIRATQLELGTTPSGGFSTVKDRLDAHEDHCQVKRSGGGTQTINHGSITTIAFDAEDFDPNGWHSTSSNNERVLPDVAGWYRVTLVLSWTADTDLTRVFGIVTKNGGTIDTDDRPYTVPTGVGVQNRVVTTLVSMNGTTDYFTATCYQENTSTGTNVMTPVMLVEFVRPA